MESEEAKKDYPDEEQRLAVANSIWEDQDTQEREIRDNVKLEKILSDMARNLQKKNPDMSKEEAEELAKILFFKKNKNKKTKETSIKACPAQISYREEEGEFYSKGFICTTHVDRYTEDGYEGTMLSHEALVQIRDAINNSIAPDGEIGSTRTASYRHDWVKQNNPGLDAAGMAMPPAEIRQTEDGQYGVWVETHHNKNHELYEKIIYDVKNGYLPGYSIEFKEGQSEPVRIKGKMIKLIKSIKNFFGYAFASARMIANPHALISGFGYREIMEMQEESHSKTKEVSNMITQEKYDALKKKEEAGEELTEEEQKQMKEYKSEGKEDKKVESKEEMKSESKKEESESDDKEEKKEKVKQKEVEEEPEESEEEAEEKESIESRESVDYNKIVDEVIKTKEYQEAINNIKPENKIKIKEADTMENISVREMNDSLGKINFQTGDGLVKYRESVGNYLESNPDYFSKVLSNPSNYTVGFNSNLKVRTVGKGLVVSGDIKVRDTLGTGDNESEYTQADVEFADVFAPGIIDTFNNQTNLFGFLNKEQHIGGEHYQWKMVTNRDPDGNDTFVGHNDVSVVKNFSSKNNYQTPLKIARRGVSVTDFINRYSARSLGDLFQLELDLQMKEMMKDVNKALFAEVADGTGNAPLGLEAVADSAGNTTLYGVSRSTANRLAPDTASDTYEAIGGATTEAKIREKMSYLETEGTALGDIVIIASPTTRDYIMNLLDGQRRFNTTEAAFGFNKMNVPSYDGVPIIVDSDCNSDALYFIDRSSDVIVIGMEPKIVQLAKVGAATEAYLEMHFAHVYKQPRRISMLDTLTS